MTKPKNISNDLFVKILQKGIITKLPELDEKPTHYFVLDSNENRLVICYSRPDWFGNYGALNHSCHCIYWDDMGKDWNVAE